MKLRIERSALVRSLAHVQNIVERRTTIPILANARLEARGETLVLTATDLDLTLVASEPAAIEREGITTVSAHTLHDIVRKLPDGATLLLDQPPGQTELQLEAGRSRFTLPTLAADEFPAPAEESFETRFTMPAADLAKLFDKTGFAVSTEETRYYLNGVHLHVTKGRAASLLRGVATDGHRLARVETALPEGAERMPPVIVPRKTVAEVRRLLEGLGDGTIEVAVSPARIQFRVAHAVLVSRLIDGTFPDYERVIPSGNERVATVPTKLFADAVDRVATISTEKTCAVKLAFEAGQVRISAVSGDSGRAQEELDASFEAESLEIGFNARYIRDMMRQIEGPELRLEMANSAAPAVARDPADPAALYVLMPMRV